MSALLFTAAAVAASVFALASLGRASTETESVSEASRRQVLERGRYLATRASMCTDCHSPRDEKGQFIEGKQLTGSPLGFAPTVPMPWTPAAPRIAGLPTGFTREDTIHFLETGERPGGRPPPLPPMPSYRFNRADAEAIATFLESLGTPKP